jgi:hypothetical protein
MRAVVTESPDFGGIRCGVQPEQRHARKMGAMTMRPHKAATRLWRSQIGELTGGPDCQRPSTNHRATISNTVLPKSTTRVSSGVRSDTKHR